MTSRTQPPPADPTPRLRARAARAGLRIASPLLRTIGRSLTVEDRLAAADAIFVHHSNPPFGAIEAAALRDAGWASEIWIAQVPARPTETELQRFGVDRPAGHEIERAILAQLAVPAQAICLLEARCSNTQGELEAVATELRRRGHHSVILVSSKHHCRRIRTLWRAVAGDDLVGLVRPASQDPFDSQRWWYDSNTAAEVLHELFGLLNAWFGSPLSLPRH